MLLPVQPLTLPSVYPTQWLDVWILRSETSTPASQNHPPKKKNIYIYIYIYPSSPFGNFNTTKKNTTTKHLPRAHLEMRSGQWLPTPRLFLLRLGWTTWSPHARWEREAGGGGERFCTVSRLTIWMVLGSNFLPNTHKARTSLREMRRCT